MHVNIKTAISLLQNFNQHRSKQFFSWVQASENLVADKAILETQISENLTSFNFIQSYEYEYMF
jgi:hypothetical protein